MPVSADQAGAHKRPYLRALLRGLFGTSWIGTLGALATCFAISVGLIVLVTSKRFMHAPTRFMADKDDVFPLLKAKAMRIAADQRGKKVYRVVLIGDSGLREAVSSLSDLNRRIAKRTSRPIEITPLLAGGLTQLDAVDLCGLLRNHMRGRVVIEVSPYWMSKGHDYELFQRVMDRTGVDSQDLCDECALAGYPRPMWVNNFFVRNYRFMLSRTDAFMRGLRPFAEPPLHHPHREHSDAATFDHDAARVYRMTHDIRNRAPEMSAVYERLIQRLQASGIEVTLLEAPQNPRLLTGQASTHGLPDPMMKFYRRARNTLAVDAKAQLWDLNQKSALKASDFADAFHIDRDAARNRFTNALAIRIAAAADASEGHVQ